jgi:hypothetical protein
VDLIKLLEDNDFASLLGLIWKKCMPFAINYYDDCVSCRNILLASSTNIYIYRGVSRFASINGAV